MVDNQQQAQLDYTRDHYNRHSNKHVDQATALRARAAGPSMPLKKFHNSVKRALINRFACGADRLLDLACGRGGDLWKWIDANIKYVKGVDLSPGEIEEARGRYQQALEKRGAGQVRTVVEFVDSSILGIEEFREKEQYDAVTCMFALHYFFVSERALKRFLLNVAINLKPGGYFFGTVPDGKSINQCVKKSSKFTSPMLTVEARWQGQPQPFGSPYICAIGDTVTGGEEGTEGSLEYLVYNSVLMGVAKEVGLEPVLDYDDPELERHLQKRDGQRLLKHFAPNFPGSDPSLTIASALFCTFVFRKRRDDENEREKDDDKDGKNDDKLVELVDNRKKRKAEDM